VANGYKRFAIWAQLSVWDKLLEELEKSADYGTGAKGGHFTQAIGRSKGGLTTKIHAVVNDYRVLL
jgi:hypothetical protein